MMDDGEMVTREKMWMLGRCGSGVWKALVSKI